MASFILTLKIARESGHNIYKFRLKLEERRLYTSFHHLQIVKCIYSVLLNYIYIGEFVLLPTDETLFVCPGKQVDITCSTNESTFLEWNVTIPHLNLSQKRTISSSNTALFVSPLDLPLSRFTFAITSKSPLMSKLSINFTTSELNGTKVLCRERANQVIDRSAEIELQIINTDTTGSWNKADSLQNDIANTLNIE